MTGDFDAQLAQARAKYNAEGDEQARTMRGANSKTLEEARRLMALQVEVIRLQGIQEYARMRHVDPNTVQADTFVNGLHMTETRYTEKGGASLLPL